MILKNKKARNGNKGIVWPHVVAAILAVAILAVVYYTILNRIPGLGDDIFALLDNLIGGGFGGIGNGYDRLADAIKCSYLRCEKGCAQANNAYYENFDCSEYCEADWTDDGTLSGKICDDRAKIHSIDVGIYEAGLSISISDLDFINGCPSAGCCIVVQEDEKPVKGGAVNKLTVQKDAIENIVESKSCSFFDDEMRECTDEITSNCGAKEVVINAREEPYYVWTGITYPLNPALDFYVTKLWTSPFTEIEIERDVWVFDYEIGLVGGSSDIYNIVMKSGNEVIDEAFLKVEERDSSLCPDWKDHPKITFVCDEKEYWDERICVDQTLVCGGFSVKFKSYTGFVNPRAVFDINYLPTSFHFICCSDENWYDGSTCPSTPPPGLNPAENLLSCEQAESNDADACAEKCLREKYKYGAPASSSSCWCNTPITKTTSRVFVTSETYTGDLGGLTGADNKCRFLAREALDNNPNSNLESDIRWRAWLSDSDKDARDRIPDLGYVYKLIDGTKIADNWADLTDGSLDNAINRDENENLVTTNRRVWTGTKGDGSKHDSRCDDWKSPAAIHKGRRGASSSITTSWTSSYSSLCSSSRRLYCFEVA